MAVFERPNKNKQLLKRFLLFSLCLCLLGVQLGCVAHNPRFNQYDSLTFAANLKADPLSPSGKKAAYSQNRIYYLSSELGEQGIYSMDACGNDLKLEIPVEDIRAIQLFNGKIYYSGFAGVQQNDDGPYRQFRLFSRALGGTESADFLASAEYKDVPKEENVWDFYISDDSLTVLRFVYGLGFGLSPTLSAVSFLNKKALTLNDFQVICNDRVNYTAPLVKSELNFVRYNNLYYETGTFNWAEYGDDERFIDWSSISVYDAAKHLVALPQDRILSTDGAWASESLLHWICRVEDENAIFATKQGLEAYDASSNTLSSIVSFTQPECVYSQIDCGDSILVFTQQLRRSAWLNMFATEVYKLNRALGESLYRVNPDTGEKTCLLKLGRNQAFLYSDREIALTGSDKTISVYDISANTAVLQKTIPLAHKIVDRANKVDSAGGWLFLYRFNEETQRDELIEKVFIES